MLTRELLRYKVAAGEIIPLLLPVTSAWLAWAGKALELFRASPGRNMVEFQEETTALAESSGHRAALRGFFQLLERRITLVPGPGEDDLARRRELLRRASARMREEALPSLSRWKVVAEQELSTSGWQGPLYPEIPARRTVAAFEDMEAGALLERYNLALVQGMLLHAHSLELELPGSSPGQLRHLLRLLRFFGLVFKAEGEGRRLHIEEITEGLAGTPRRRAAGLASLMAFLPQLPFELEARLEIPGAEPGRLRLDGGAGLRSSSPPFFDYVPDELRVFRDSANAALRELGFLCAEAPLPSGAPAQWAVPDFSWRAPDGRELHIEIFRDAAPLRRRVEQCASAAPARTVFAVERRLFKDEKQTFPVPHFTFRDIPAPRRFLECARAAGFLATASEPLGAPVGAETKPI